MTFTLFLRLFLTAVVLMGTFAALSDFVGTRARSYGPLCKGAAIASLLVILAAIGMIWTAFQ